MLTTEQIVRIKIMRHYNVKGRDIAKAFNLSEQRIHNMQRDSRRYRDAKVCWTYETTHPDPRPYDPNHTKTLKHGRFSAGPCIICEKALIDGIGDDFIYLVRVDKYLCGERCENKYRIS